MGNPIGIAVGNDNLVYVLNRQQEQISDVSWDKTGVHAKIEMYTIGPVPGDEEAIGDFGGYGNGPGKLIWPAGIALDSAQNLYVTDEWMNTVVVFGEHGSFTTSWGSSDQSEINFNQI